MKWKFSHNTIDNILMVKTEGILDIDSANVMRNEGAELIKQHGYLRCLLDHTNVEGITYSTLDIYFMPKRYEELNIPRNFRMAVVVTDKLITDLRFYETVCRNNGYSVSVFFNYEEALAWLMS